MTKADWIHLSLLTLISALGSACGAAVPPPRAAVVPAEAVATPAAEPSGMNHADAEAFAPPPPPAAPVVAAPQTATATGGAAFAPGSLGGSDDLASAEKLLKASLGDCVTACRALGSMERATAHLCGMASSSDDQRTCQDAKTRVLSGRDRVRASCSVCPNGPSLDKSAPIPSTR